MPLANVLYLTLTTAGFVIFALALAYSDWSSSR